LAMINPKRPDKRRISAARQTESKMNANATMDWTAIQRCPSLCAKCARSCQHPSNVVKIAKRRGVLPPLHANILRDNKDGVTSGSSSAPAHSKSGHHQNAAAPRQPTKSLLWRPPTSESKQVFSGQSATRPRRWRWLARQAEANPRWAG